MSLRSSLGLAEPGTEEPQQGLPILRLCWDPLFNFFIRFFKPLRSRKAVIILANLDAETSTNYKVVFSWEVEAGFEGILNEISLYSSRPDTTSWRLVISDQEQFRDKKIYISLTMPWKELPIIAGQKVLLQAKTDGTATDIAGCLVGESRYLGK
ncbi:unnamed protein product [marine sediment metagenome]|uniref:Uncharacterized protein n=1 Tax=marine sediment metagenome TaxID=412755 RepID=X1RYQ4_9ZZZZ